MNPLYVLFLVAIALFSIYTVVRGVSLARAPKIENKSAPDDLNWELNQRAIAESRRS